jgi:Zn-dependent peptidase ImmA (M78 family)
MWPFKKKQQNLGAIAESRSPEEACANAVAEERVRQGVKEELPKIAGYFSVPAETLEFIRATVDLANAADEYWAARNAEAFWVNQNDSRRFSSEPTVVAQFAEEVKRSIIDDVERSSRRRVTEDLFVVALEAYRKAK